MSLLPGSQRYKERMKQKWALREECKLVFPTKQKKKNGVEHIPAGEGLVSETNELSRCSPYLRGAYSPSPT